MSERTSPNILVTGTPGVGKSSHCERLVESTGLRYLSINDIAKERDCYEGWDDELKTNIVDEDKLLDSIEEEVKQGGNIIDWHACDAFPESWIDLVIVLRTDTDKLYDRLRSRNYPDAKLQENLDSEIMEVLLQEARDGFEPEVVQELPSNDADDLESNVERIETWIKNWKVDHGDHSG